MRGKISVWLLAAALLTTAPLAQGQQPTSRPRIGYLSGVSPSAETARREAFSRGLRELGYVEGKTIIIEHRYSEGNYNRLAGLATELVRLKPDLIVTGGSPSTRAAKEVTGTIPIVMTNDPDPVANGFVASLALPAGNVTGLSTLAPELSGKRLGILREVVPTLTRIAVLATSTSPAYAPVKKEIDLAAKALKLAASIPRRFGWQRHRTGISSCDQGSSGCVHHAQQRCSGFPNRPDCVARRKEPAPGNVYPS